MTIRPIEAAVICHVDDLVWFRLGPGWADESCSQDGAAPSVFRARYRPSWLARAATFRKPRAITLVVNSASFHCLPE